LLMVCAAFALRLTVALAIAGIGRATLADTPVHSSMPLASRSEPIRQCSGLIKWHASRRVRIKFYLEGIV
jgi:hypothetical protein